MRSSRHHSSSGGRAPRGGHELLRSPRRAWCRGSWLAAWSHRHREGLKGLWTIWRHPAEPRGGKPQSQEQPLSTVLPRAGTEREEGVSGSPRGKALVALFTPRIFQENPVSLEQKEGHN